MDQNNNLYIADSTTLPAGTELLRRVSNGIITTAASNLNNPYGVAVDKAGAVYVSDSRNYRILRVSTNGTDSSSCGQRVLRIFRRRRPRTVGQLVRTSRSKHVVLTGDLYVVDSGQQPSVRRITGSACSGGVSAHGSGFFQFTDGHDLRNGRSNAKRVPNQPACKLHRDWWHLRVDTLRSALEPPARWF